MTEREWVRSAAKGDEESFALLVERYQDQVYRLALRMCHSEEDALDVAQEAFLAAWRGLPRFRGDAMFSTWLFRLTSNAAIDHMRKNKHQKGEIPLDDPDSYIEPADPAPGPERMAEDDELRTAVMAGFAGLSDAHREILTLRELRGLSYDEIGDRLGLDTGTVKSRISRARAALRKNLLADGNLSGYLPSNDNKRADRKGGRP